MKKIYFIVYFITVFTAIVRAQEEGITVKQNNVGIGTIDPQSILHLNGQLAPELVIEFDDTIGGYGEFQLRDQNAKKWSIGVHRNGDSIPNSFYIWQYTDSINNSVNQQRFTIDNYGKVGIGTESPERALHIIGQNGTDVKVQSNESNSQVGFRMQNDSREWRVRVRGSNADAFEIKDITGNAIQFVIDTTGQIGFGTATPAYKLHIQGASDQLSQIESVDGGATQLRLKTNSENRRILGEDGSGSQKSQIAFEDEAMKIFGPTSSTNPLTINTDGTNNIGINHINSFGTSAKGVIGIGEGTAPTSSPVNMVQLYVDSTTSSSAELKVRDEAGNITVLSDSQLQNLSYTAGSRQLNISSGSGTTLPIFTSSQAGLTPASGGGTNNFLRADGTWNSPNSDISYLSSTLSSDVSLSPTNTWINGPSLELTAGTWLVNCNLNLHGNLSTSSTYWYGRISTGSTHFVGSQTKTSGSARLSINLNAIITVASTTTIYGQARQTNQNSGSPVIRASENISGTFPVTNMTAIKLN